MQLPWVLLWCGGLNCIIDKLGLKWINTSFSCWNITQAHRWREFQAMTRDYFWPRWTARQLQLVPKLLEMIFWIPALTQPPKWQFYVQRKFLLKLVSLGLAIRTSPHTGVLMYSSRPALRKTCHLSGKVHLRQKQWPTEHNPLDLFSLEGKLKDLTEKCIH